VEFRAKVVGATSREGLCSFNHLHGTECPHYALRGSQIVAVLAVVVAAVVATTDSQTSETIATARDESLRRFTLTTTHFGITFRDNDSSY